jgi:hypothetical protein
MNVELILAILISLNLYIGLTTVHVVWRVLSFKFAVDLFAIFLMSFAGKSESTDLSMLGIGMMFSTTVILFLMLVTVLGAFKEKKNEKNSG